MNHMRRVPWLRAIVATSKAIGAPAALAAALLLLAACTVTEPAPGVPLQAGPDSGLAVFSLTRTGWRDFDLMVEAKGSQQWVGRSVVMLAQSKSRDWVGGPDWLRTPADAPEGRLVVMRLAPGTYRIERWNGDSTRNGFQGNGYRVYGNLQDLTFSVALGGVTYLGNLGFIFEPQLNWVATVSHGTYRIDVSDQHERDLALLRTRFPSTDTAAMRSELFRFPESGQPLTYYLVNYGDTDAEPPTPE